MTNEKSKVYRPEEIDVINILYSFIADTIAHSDNAEDDLEWIRSHPWLLDVNDAEHTFHAHILDSKDAVLGKFVLLKCVNWEDLIVVPIEEFQAFCDKMFSKYKKKSLEVVQM